MRRSSFVPYLLVFLMLALTACLQERQVTSVDTGTSWFEGVRSVKNRGGTPPSILVQWNAASVPVTSYRIYSLIYDPVTKTNRQELIKEVSGETTSYLYSNELTPGSTYTFMVRAVDTSGAEDNNRAQMSTVAFNGISNARITGTTTATVFLESSIGSFDEVRVYAQPDYENGVKTLVAKATGDVSTIPITGLKSGVKYRFYINAYMSYLNAEDGNDLFVSGQTYSESYGSGAAAEDKSVYAYRGMISVKAFGDAPNSAVEPKTRQVSLTWLPFANSNSITVYRVIRTEASQVVTTNTTLPCTSATDLSCLVACVNVGSGPQTCVDTQVGAPPKTYNYVVSLHKTDPLSGESWTEELPSVNFLDFYTKVAIPPDNMVLIQRDAANYDMCKMLGTDPNPRKNQRCTYTGIAAVPYNRGPNKPPLNLETGYYDFGYNLFVDRFQTGCNWTRVSPSCGPDGCVGITSYTTGSAPPSDSLGINGDVYYALNGGWGNNCYIKKNNTWQPIGNSTTITAAEYNRALTVDPQPDGKTPSANGFSQQTAFMACNAQSTEYGNKRLLRRREAVHHTAFPTHPGEPGSITDLVELSYLITGRFSSGKGGQQEGYRRCSGGDSSVLTTPTTIADLLAPTNYRAQLDVGVSPILSTQSKKYFISTPATERCISRWGAQDPISPGGTGSNPILADTFMRTNDINEDPATFMPVDSDYDSGVVKDWSNMFFTYVFNGMVGPTFGTSAQWSMDIEFNATTSVQYQSYILPLGMALVPATTSSAIYAPYRPMSTVVYNGALGGSTYSAGGQARYNLIWRNSNFSSLNILRYVMLQGQQQRFSFSMHPDQTTTRFAMWCGIEAE